MRIDVHAHYFPVEYLDLVDRHAGTKITQFFRQTELASQGFSGLDKHVENMDLKAKWEGLNIYQLGSDASADIRLYVIPRAEEKKIAPSPSSSDF